MGTLTREEGIILKKILGITFGGLQRKTVTLVLMVLFLTIGIFSIVAAYQNRLLIRLVEETKKEQQDSISGISKENMAQTLKASMISTNGLQAAVADQDFSEVVNNISMLQSMAQGLIRDREALQPANFSRPDPGKEGTYSAMVLCEEGVDPGQSEYLGVIAHMSESMIAMAENSDKISGCYIGLADGTDLCVDDKPSNKYDEQGQPIPFPVRQRPWYKGAVEKGDVYFTGLEKDAFSGHLCITCSAPVVVGGRTVGVVGIDILLDHMEHFIQASSNNSGLVFMVNDKGQVVLAPKDQDLFSVDNSDYQRDLREHDNKDLSAFISQSLQETTDLSLLEVDGREYYMVGSPMPTIGWAVISAVSKDVTELPEKELLARYDKINNQASETFRSGTARSTRTSIAILLFIVLLATFAALVAARHIVRPIVEMTRDIHKSSQTGQLFEMKDTYRTNDEIEILAEAFDDLSKKTRQYIENITEITREKERVSTELHMANRIQNSMLPNVFPPYPERKEFDIFASMEPAREVGGDFYDFFMIDHDHLCMVMADVSGKGIPAALFMMISKVILQSCAMLGQSAAEILVKTNEAICSSNQVDMFVTVWLGILEISSGKIRAANAGHEYPALMQNGSFSLLKGKHGLVIGGMDGVKYREYEIDLSPGDRLFLYTDGIPEASDKDHQMFGNDRMIEALNQDPQASPRQIISNVRDAVEAFTKGAEQFDDMTMLCMEYKGNDRV